MVFTWVRSLILYLLLAGLAVNMAPASQYKQYIRYFTGLVVIILLAKPIGYLYQLGSGDLEEIVANISDMDGVNIKGIPGKQGEDILDYYDVSLRMSIIQELEQFGVEDVDLVTNDAGNILSCTVFLRDASAEEEAEIKSYIWDVYNVNKTRIYVVRR